MGIFGAGLLDDDEALDALQELWERFQDGEAAAQSFMLELLTKYRASEQFDPDGARAVAVASVIAYRLDAPLFGGQLLPELALAIIGLHFTISDDLRDFAVGALRQASTAAVRPENRQWQSGFRAEAKRLGGLLRKARGSKVPQGPRVRAARPGDVVRIPYASNEYMFAQRLQEKYFWAVRAGLGTGAESVSTVLSWPLARRCYLADEVTTGEWNVIGNCAIPADSSSEYRMLSFVASPSATPVQVLHGTMSTDEDLREGDAISTMPFDTMESAQSLQQKMRSVLAGRGWPDTAEEARLREVIRQQAAARGRRLA